MVLFQKPFSSGKVVTKRQVSLTYVVVIHIFVDTPDNVARIRNHSGRGTKVPPLGRCGYNFQKYVTDFLSTAPVKHNQHT